VQPPPLRGDHLPRVEYRLRRKLLLVTDSRAVGNVAEVRPSTVAAVFCREEWNTCASETSKRLGERVVRTGGDSSRGVRLVGATDNMNFVLSAAAHDNINQCPPSTVRDGYVPAGGGHLARACRAAGQGLPRRGVTSPRFSPPNLQRQQPGLWE